MKESMYTWEFEKKVLSSKPFLDKIEPYLGDIFLVQDYSIFFHTFNF